MLTHWQSAFQFRLIAALSHILSMTSSTDLIWWLHHQRKGMCCSISCLHSAPREPTALPFTVPREKKIEKIWSLPLVGEDIIYFADKTCFAPILALFPHMRLSRGALLKERSEKKRLNPHSSLASGFLQRVRVHVSADFLTAAPCCRPAVAQGDANPFSHSTWQEQGRVCTTRKYQNQLARRSNAVLCLSSAAICEVSVWRLGQ